MGVGGRRRLYTYPYTVTTRMTCIKMGSDESHFSHHIYIYISVVTNVILILGRSVEKEEEAASK